VNHNGISEPEELLGLSAAQVAAIELNYKLSERVDEYGNQFRYRTKVTETNQNQVGRWAWDVILISTP